MSEAGGRYRGSAPSGPFVEETSVLARSLVSAEPSPHDEGFKGKRKGCKGSGRSQPWTSKHHRSRTWCRSRARTTQLPSRGSDLLHHLHPFFILWTLRRGDLSPRAITCERGTEFPRRRV